MSVATQFQRVVERRITMMKLLKRVRVSKSGASAAEYALILAVIGGGIVVAATTLSGSITSAMQRTTTTLNTAGV